MRGAGESAVVVPLDDPGWRMLVQGHPRAGPFHRPSWAELIGRCYRFPVFALVLPSSDGTLLAGVPVVAVARGRRWVSLPFTDNCEPLLAPGVTLAEAVRAFDLARRAAGVEQLVVRAPLPGTVGHPGTASFGHELCLEGSERDVLKRIRSNQRAEARQAVRLGVHVRVATTARDLTSDFYDLHVRTRHRLGVPAQPRRYFDMLWRRVLADGGGRLLLATYEGRSLAGTVVLAHEATAVYKYSAWEPTAGPSQANQLLLLEAVRWAHRLGCSRFDLGRTAPGDTGLRAYKRRWSDVEHALHDTVLADRPPRPTSGEVPRLAREVLRRGPRALVPLVGAALYRRTA